MSLRKKVRKALDDSRLQAALGKASSQHFQKHKQTVQEIPWEELKERARSIREQCLPCLPELIERFRAEAEKAGAKTYFASTPQEARECIAAIAAEKKAAKIVKSKSMVSEEIGLNAFLEERGLEVLETDLGEWIVQLAGERPSHITAPALHKTKEDVAELLAARLGKPIPPDIPELVKAARSELRGRFLEADIGISGANLAVAESGTLVLISNEGNARLVTTLPPVHIAVITVEKFVETLEQASTLVKALTTASSGMKLTAYVSFITGPSRTTDIEKELVLGVHGPREVHIVILDNGRLATVRDDRLKETLYCLKCGGCLLVCPVFQVLGGHAFGGPVYPGGIGLLLTALTRSMEEGLSLSSLCADCKKCEAFCPVRIPTSDLLLDLKARKGPALWERVLSSLFPKRRLQEAGARLLSLLLKPWTRDGMLLKPPLLKKTLPVLNLKKEGPVPSRGNGRRIFLFQGCLVRFFFPEIRKSVREVFSRQGFDVVCPPEQVCCGAPSLHLGHEAAVRKLAKANIRAFEDSGAEFIVTVCPTGNSVLRTVYPRLLPESSKWAKRIFDFTEFMARKGSTGKKKSSSGRGDVLYHYSCHALNDLGLKSEPLEVLKEAGYAPRVEEEPFACCGFCGIFSFKNPDLAARLWEEKKRKILASPADSIATDCPGCILQLRTNLSGKGRPKRIGHTAQFLDESLG